MTDAHLLIAIAAVAWSAGLFVGMFTSKFVGKKQCTVDMDKIWNRIDALQDCMTGGKITFELRPVIERREHKHA